MCKHQDSRQNKRYFTHSASNLDPKRVCLGVHLELTLKEQLPTDCLSTDLVVKLPLGPSKLSAGLYLPPYVAVNRCKTVFDDRLSFWYGSN